MGLFDQTFCQCSRGSAANPGEVGFGGLEHLGDLGEGGAEAVGDGLVLRRDGFGRGLGEDRGDQSVDGLGAGRPELLGDVAGEMNLMPMSA